MKIVFVSQPLSTGGAERVVAALANKFVELGHEVKVVVVDNGDSNIYYTHEEIEFIHIAKPSNPFFDLLYRAKKMRTYFAEYKPDVIIPFTTQKNVSVLLATLFTKHKVIACERNNPKEDPSNKILRMLRILLFWTAEGFVFQTENARDYFTKGIRSKSIVIPNPISEMLIEAWQGEREKRIVMASRLNPQKNIDMAIDAMEIISKKYPDYVLEIYGKSYAGLYDYENHLKKRVEEKKLQDHVAFKGFCSNVHERIKKASIFLITSNHEGMSNSLMEALALGLVCISTDDPNGGAKALIQDRKNGMLVPVGDSEACTAALVEAISDGDLRKKCSKNAIKIRDEMSIDRIANKWLEYINEVVRR